MASAIELLLLAQASVTTTQYVPPGGQLINATGMTNVISWSVAPASYWFRVFLGYTSGVSAGTPSVQLTLSGGAAASSIGYIFSRYDSTGAMGVTFRTTAGSALTGPTLSSAGSVFILEGDVTFSAGGTFAVQAATSNAADTWTIQSGSYMQLVPQQVP